MSSDDATAIPSAAITLFALLDAAAIGTAAYLVFEAPAVAALLGALSGAGGYLLLPGLLGRSNDAPERGFAGTGLDRTALGLALSNAAIGGFVGGFVGDPPLYILGGALALAVPGYGFGLVFVSAMESEASPTAD